MAVDEAAAWFDALREDDYRVRLLKKEIESISRRLTTAKEAAEVAKLKTERMALCMEIRQVSHQIRPCPDFNRMTEAERAAMVERLRRDELDYALRLTHEGDPLGPSLQAVARIVDFDPKQGGLYHSRFTLLDLTKFDLDEESPIGPMRHIDSPRKRESDYFYLPTAVNFLFVSIASSDVGYPICVYGTIVVRDSMDSRFVYHFRRDSDNCQQINSEDDSLILTGPKRGLELFGDMCVEIDLKMKDDLVQDRELSKGLMVIREASTGPSATGYTFHTRSLATRLSTVDVTYTVVDGALEGTIAVEVVQGGFHGKITASTTNMGRELVLYNSNEADATTVVDCGDLKLARPVLCLYIEDFLMISAHPSDGKSERIAFTPEINARAERSLVLGGTKLCVKICWSVMYP